MQKPDFTSRGWCGLFPPETSSNLENHEMMQEFTPTLSPVAWRLCTFFERFTHLLCNVLSSTSPATIRYGLIAIFMLTVGIASHGNAHAQTVSGNGLLNGMYNHIVIDTLPFFSNSFNIADMIFGAVGTMAVMTALVNYLTEYRTFSGSGNMILKLVIQIAIPWTFMKIAETLMSSWSIISSNVGSYIIGAGNMDLTPGGIFKIGGVFAGEMIKSVALTAFSHALSFKFNLVEAAPYYLTFLIGIVCTFILVATFTLLAIEMLAAFAQGYISLSVGAFNLGWSASPTTSPFAMAYWGLALNAITRIIVTMGIIGIGLSEANDWLAQLHNIEVINPDLFASNSLTLIQSPMLGVGLLYLTKRVTDIAASQLSGRPVLGAASFLNSGGGTSLNLSSHSSSQQNGGSGKGTYSSNRSSSNGANSGETSNSSQLPIRRGPPRW